MDKKTLAAYLITLGGVLIILWGILHVLIVPEIQRVLIKADVVEGIINLISLSYLGIVIMISVSGLLVIISALLGIKQGEKWAFYYVLTQGLIFGFVSIMLIALCPLVSVAGFEADFILFLAILTDIGIAVLTLGPLIIWHKEFL
ncbi:MAG: hypothetical protein ACTSR8_09725 [Promethearchaeota archaeon]